MAVETKDLGCLELAATQLGVISRAEALRFLSVQQLERRLASGLMIPVFRSIYRVAGAPDCWRQKLEALSMWAGQGAALSHRTAAALHGFARFEEGPLEVTVTSQRIAPEGVVVHFTGPFGKKDVIDVTELRCTSAARTLLDLSARTDAPTMRATIDEALRRKLTTVKELRGLLVRSKNRPGVPCLRSLLQEFEASGGPAESELEALMLELIDSAGLPRPTKQKRGTSGDKRVRVDFLFEGYGVILEGDGYAFHSGIDDFEADRQRNNMLAASGLFVLRWTWQALQERPEELVSELLATLNARQRLAS